MSLTTFPTVSDKKYFNGSIEADFKRRRIEQRQTTPQCAADLIYRLILEEVFPRYYVPLCQIAGYDNTPSAFELMTLMANSNDIPTFIDAFFRIFLSKNINKAIWTSSKSLAEAYKTFLCDHDYDILLTNMLYALCIQYGDKVDYVDKVKYRKLRARLTTETEG